MRDKLYRVLIGLLSLAMLTSFVACGSATGDPSPPNESPAESQSGDSTVSSSEPSNPDSITVTDQAGREVMISNSVEKIVSGYYISSSTCIALGLADKLVGIEAKADTRPIYALAAAELLELPNVGTAKEFNLEGCLSLEPDLVILPLRLKDQADIISELGIPVLLVNPENQENLVEMIALIGQATGVDDRAASLISYCENQLSTVDELTANISETPSVYIGGNSAYLETAPKDMYQSSLIEAAGGVNAAANIAGDNWINVSYEEIIAMNPDVIVIPSEAGYSKEDVLGDAELANITAIKEGKVYKMPGSFEAWDSPVPSCTLGILWMLNVLHEDTYSNETLKSDAADFYKEFYNVEIDTSLIVK